MKRYIFSIFAAATLAGSFALAGCQKDPNTVTNYLRLSDNSFAFDAIGNQTYTVNVTSSTGEWEFAKEGDWMTVERAENGLSLTVTAGVNQSTASLSGKITVRNNFSESEITVSQLGQGEPGAPRFGVLTEYGSFIISPGGKKALACTEEVLDDAGFINSTFIYVIDIATDERTELTSIEEYDELFEAGAISDDGSVIIINGKEEFKAKRYNLDTEEWEAVAMMAQDDYENWVSAISADGTIWVGYGCSRGSQGNRFYYPIKWVNGVPEKMSAPTINGIGEDVFNGTMARGCSADGSVIYGSIWDDMEAIYWKEDGTWAFVVPDLMEVKTKQIQGMFGPTELLALNTPFLDSNTMRMSSDGKWLALNYRSAEFREKQTMFGTNWVAEFSVQPLFVDLETGEYTIIDNDNVRFAGDPTLFSGGGIGVTDDGTFFYGPYRNANGGGGIVRGFAYDSGTTMPTASWIQSTYGLYTMGEYWVRKDFNGGKTVVGYKMAPSLIGTNYFAWYITTEGI